MKALIALLVLASLSAYADNDFKNYPQQLKAWSTVDCAMRDLDTGKTLAKKNSIQVDMSGQTFHQFAETEYADIAFLIDASIPTNLVAEVKLIYKNGSGAWGGGTSILNHSAGISFTSNDARPLYTDFEEQNIQHLEAVCQPSK